MNESGLVTKPRIIPLGQGEGDDDIEELLAGLGERGSSNFFRTLARHPRILKRWFRYGHVLLHGALPDRDRELLVLRAAHLSQSSYEWDAHAPIAADCGLTEEEMARVRLGPDDDNWSAWDATVLRAADELLDSHTLSDSTWAALAERYDERQMIELPMVVGVYYAMGFTLNTLGVQAEPGTAAAKDRG